MSQGFFKPGKAMPFCVFISDNEKLGIIQAFQECRQLQFNRADEDIVML